MYTNIKEKFINKKILVLCGGFSKEREISLLTGEAVFLSLKKMNFNVEKIDFKKENFDLINWDDFDVVFIALHGEGGEDGKIQAFLDIKNIPYTGPGFVSSSLAMNKFFAKQIFLANKINTANFFKIDIFEKNNLDEIYLKNKMLEIRIDFPIIVKPVNNGSAIGVHIVNNFNDFIDSINEIFLIDKEVLIEQYIFGREFTVGICKDKIFPVLEIVSKNKFYDYEAKYKIDVSNHFIPKDLDEKIIEKMQILAKKTVESLFIHETSRVDMIMQNNKIFVLEVNTIPGMTETSLFPFAAEKINISFDGLVLLILETSEK